MPWEAKKWGKENGGLGRNGKLHEQGKWRITGNGWETWDNVRSAAGSVMFPELSTVTGPLSGHGLVQAKVCSRLLSPSSSKPFVLGRCSQFLVGAAGVEPVFACPEWALLRVEVSFHTRCLLTLLLGTVLQDPDNCSLHVNCLLPCVTGKGHVLRPEGAGLGSLREQQRARQMPLECGFASAFTGEMHYPSKSFPDAPRVSPALL